MISQVKLLCAICFRYPFTSSFADPVRHYEEQNRSASPAEETSSAPGNKHPSNKSS